MDTQEKIPLGDQVFFRSVWSTVRGKYGIYRLSDDRGRGASKGQIVKSAELEGSGQLKIYLFLYLCDMCTLYIKVDTSGLCFDRVLSVVIRTQNYECMVNHLMYIALCLESAD